MERLFGRLGIDGSSQPCKPCRKYLLISKDIFQDLMEKETLGFSTSGTQCLPKPPVTSEWNRRRLDISPGPCVIHCLHFQQCFLAAETTNTLPAEWHDPDTRAPLELLKPKSCWSTHGNAWPCVSILEIHWSWNNSCVHTWKICNKSYIKWYTDNEIKKQIHEVSSK